MVNAGLVLVQGIIVSVILVYTPESGLDDIQKEHLMLALSHDSLFNVTCQFGE